MFKSTFVGNQKWTKECAALCFLTAWEDRKREWLQETLFSLMAHGRGFTPSEQCDVDSHWRPFSALSLSYQTDSPSWALPSLWKCDFVIVHVFFFYSWRLCRFALMTECLMTLILTAFLNALRSSVLECWCLPGISNWTLSRRFDTSIDDSISVPVIVVCSHYCNSESLIG